MFVMTSHRRILITGAAGALGRCVRDGLVGAYEIVRSTDIAPLAGARNGEEVEAGDLRDLDDAVRLATGVDAIVHLAGIPREADWETIRDVNIDGTYHVYEAARLAGVRRVIFASSNHTVGFYRRDTPIGREAPVRPDSRYGVSKVVGEALARLYADKYGIESVCLRIGQFRPQPTNPRMLALWISERDLVSLIRCSLDTDGVHFEVVYGISDNSRGWYEDPYGRLPFKPRDNAESQATDDVLADRSESLTPVSAVFQGGPYCEDEFSGSPDRIS
ncbi:NAD-dependent epimerase/dehydratase family protein [Tardiphaga robiniae]|uniref:NAD(P)-dependent oxidoreductase n=1 Tax=Tardiphaga robiniae TaxID=943830 RepID=A0A7G6U1D3_9BRAD|nr:NAD(P)-dependent oxidoreductase [Tardiphaga robiniae]QND72815.1 NAD(P)-dependent oxidoreductase [Tardiphaga robiniae]